MSQYDFECECGEKGKPVNAYGAKIIECVCGNSTPPRKSLMELQVEWDTLMHQRKLVRHNVRHADRQPQPEPEELTRPPKPRCDTCQWRGELYWSPKIPHEEGTEMGIQCHVKEGQGRGDTAAIDGWCSAHWHAEEWTAWRFESEEKERANANPTP